MKLVLSDAANWAQILSLPLAVILWFFTREWAVKFWKMWAKWIMSALALLMVVTLWRIGWLAWLALPVTWPLWALVVLFLAGPCVLGLRFLLLAHQSKRPPSPNHRDYRSDSILEIEWVWQYDGRMIDSFSIAAFCPKQGCSHRLDQSAKDYDWQASREVGCVLSCPRCGFTSEFPENQQELRRRVAGEIERRIRTGEFAKKPITNGGSA